MPVGSKHPTMIQRETYRRQLVNLHTQPSSLVPPQYCQSCHKVMTRRLMISVHSYFRLDLPDRAASISLLSLVTTYLINIYKLQNIGISADSSFLLIYDVISTRLNMLGRFYRSVSLCHSQFSPSSLSTASSFRHFPPSTHHRYTSKFDLYW